LILTNTTYSDILHSFSQHLKMRPYFLTLFFAVALNLFSTLGFGQVLVDDLSNRWLYLEEETNTYRPITYQKLSDLNAISFSIAEYEFNGQQISLSTQVETSVFVNQQIFSKITDTIIWDLDSLKEALGSKSLFFTIYSSKPLEAPINTQVVAVNSTIDLEKGLDEFLPIPRKDAGQFIPFFIITGLLVLVLISILRRVYSKYFVDFYGFEAFFRNRVREDAFMRNSLINPVSLTFYSVHSLLLGLLLLAFVQYYPDAPSSLTFLKSDRMEMLWLNWLLSSALIFVLILLKFMLVSYFGSLFAVRSAQTGHFSDYMQMSLIFFLLVFFFVFVTFKWLTGSPIAVSVLLVATLIFSFFRVIVLFFKLMRQTNFRNLHLISYLCATELIPLLISIKLFL